MAQIIPPDFERLSGCFVGAAEECARLQNLPSIDNSQRLLDLMGELRGDMHQRAEQHTAQLVTIQADIASLRADFTSLRADVTTLRVDVADMQTAFTARWDAR